VIVASGHATFVSPFGSSFLLTFLLFIHYNLFTRKPCFQENAFGKVGFAMVLLPTKAYVGTGNPPVDGYVKFCTGSVLLGGMESPSSCN